MEEQEKAGREKAPREWAVSFYVTFNVTADDEDTAYDKAVEYLDECIERRDLGDFVNVDDPFITEA